MADSPHRASITSHTTAPDAWDAGVHAESDAGRIDVGLCVEPTALGLIVEAPGVGTLKVAFDVTPDGTTRLAKASRRLADGRDVGVIAVDEAQVLKLSGELERLRSTFHAVRHELEELNGTVTSERDEARQRAKILSDEKKALAREEERLTAEVSRLTAALEVEKAHALEALADREKARAALETARVEAAEPLPALDAAQEKATALAAAAGALEAALAEKEAELEALRAQAEGAGALEAQLAEARAQLQEVQHRAVAEAADASAHVATLEEQLADTSARLDAIEAELATARATAEATQARLQRTEVELTDATLQASALETDREGRGDLEAELAAAQRELGTLREELAARAQLEALPRQLETLRAALQANEAELARRDESLSLAVEQRDALQAQLASVDDALTAQQRATDEARDIARRLKAQADGLLAERDEARAVARQLHQRLSSSAGKDTADLQGALEAERQVAATLLAEKHALAQRLEALERLAAQERDGRGQALAERDEWRSRFQALARGGDGTGVRDMSREDTLSYNRGVPTQPEVPAVSREATTDPAIPKKGL